jgi:16S rRNA processing protein RimM
LRGEVSILPITNRSERFAPGSSMYVDDRALIVATARRHHDRWLVRFEGIDDRDAADALRGRVLTADPLSDAADDELWVHEVIGSEVRDRAGKCLGVVTGVEANPAHDLLVLDGHVLVPVVFVVTTEPGVVIVELPEGLLDL